MRVEQRTGNGTVRRTGESPRAANHPTLFKPGEGGTGKHLCILGVASSPKIAG